MKILHVLPSLSPGGMEGLAIQLAGDAVGHGDRAVIASGPGAWVDKATAAGAEHFALPATSRGAVADMASAVALLGRGIRKLRPHVVHSHNVRATALARLALLTARHQAALVPTLHGVDPSGIVRRTGRSASRRAGSLLARQLSLARCRRLAFLATGSMSSRTAPRCSRPTINAKGTCENLLPSGRGLSSWALGGLPSRRTGRYSLRPLAASTGVLLP